MKKILLLFIFSFWAIKEFGQANSWMGISKNWNRTNNSSTVAVSTDNQVTYQRIKAWQHDGNVAIQWVVENQNGIKRYEVEKSTDSNDFIKVNTQIPINNTGAIYNWLDVNSVEGDNYYRICSISLNDSVSYSQIVKVSIGDNASSITAYPNPITNAEIRIQFINTSAGQYQVNLINNIGDVLLTKDIELEAGSATETIQLSHYLPKGIYILDILHPDKTSTQLDIVY